MHNHSRAGAWTSATPTEPGFYWLRVAGEFEAEIVRVIEWRGTLRMHVCGSDKAVPLEAPQHEWLGPLVPPS